MSDDKWNETLVEKEVNYILELEDALLSLKMYLQELAWKPVNDTSPLKP